MNIQWGWAPSPRAERPDEDDHAVRRTDQTDHHRTRPEGNTDHV